MIDSKSFEEKWHLKLVRPRGKHYQIPIKNYTVTAALYYENDESVFAIMSDDYVIGTNPEWFTIKVAPEDIYKIEEDFEVI